MTTYGEQAVGLAFNPSADPDVDLIKRKFADIIDFCAGKRAAAVDPAQATATKSSERARLFSIAITEAQTAQMWAVKALTWKD